MKFYPFLLSILFLFFICPLRDAMSSKFHTRFLMEKPKLKSQFSSNPKISRVIEDVLDAVADFITYAVMPEQRVSGNYYTSKIDNRIDSNRRENDLDYGELTDHSTRFVPELMMRRRPEFYRPSVSSPPPKDKFTAFMEFVSPLLALVWLLFSGPPTVVDIPARRLRREAEEKPSPVRHELFLRVPVKDMEVNNQTHYPKLQYLKLRGSNGRFISFSTRSFGSNNPTAHKIRKVPLRILNFQSPKN